MDSAQPSLPSRVRVDGKVAELKLEFGNRWRALVVGNFLAAFRGQRRPGGTAEEQRSAVQKNNNVSLVRPDATRAVTLQCQAHAEGDGESGD